jgi:adenylosuccinate lyase
MLEAISPVDGRYANKTKALSPFFSEYALIKYRVIVEVHYFIALTNLPLPGLEDFPVSKKEALIQIGQHFSVEDAKMVKLIEGKTNHDVKAVEYFLKDRFDALGLEDYKEMIHFGLTSQDINNTAVPLSIHEALHTVLLPGIDAIIQQLVDLANQWKGIPMLARTHGQPASPTLLGKELYVYIDRLLVQLHTIRAMPMTAKFGGATGNLNAHVVTFPDIDWIAFSNQFVQSLGMTRQKHTTQIEHYDQLAALFHNLKRINTILIDLSRDVWMYISQNYFKQKVIAGEVGSSTMPHKVNPIDFENAEGNFGVANAVYGHLADKLPVSRLQRDLTDSTVLRNVGVPFAHSLIGFKSLLKGLGKLELNHHAIQADLEANWAVVGEAYQTILRREGVANPYELLKAFTRGVDQLTKTELHRFVDSLPVSANVKSELKRITPANYTGVADW